jgi:hypothetical protein
MSQDVVSGRLSLPWSWLPSFAEPREQVLGRAV